MDLEQITKKLDWLDEERRKDKASLETLRDRLNSLEANQPAVLEKTTALEADLARITTALGRFEQVEAAIAQLRVDFSRNLDNLEKLRTERERDMEKVRRADLDTLNKAIAENRKALDALPEIKRNLHARQEEDFRLGKLIEELDTRYTEDRRAEEDYRRSQRLLDDTRRQDSKRLLDLQAEMATMRKRLEEHRGKVDLLSDSTRKLEVRLQEIQNAESERRQNQTTFMEKFSLTQVERDRAWKEMQTRFEQISDQAATLETTLQTLDATQRAVKRSQDTLDEATQRFDRRVNELTEMQRLAEDRFRQEWVAFKADDQKRWANYSLVQDEQLNEINRQFEKHNDRLTRLENLSSEMRDLLHEITEEEQNRLQTLLATFNQFLQEQERLINRPQ